MKDEKIIAKFLGKGGYEKEREIAKNLLVVGKIYNLVDLYIGSSYSQIWIKGFEDSFNSVMFEYYRDGVEIDLIDEYAEMFGY